MTGYRSQYFRHDCDADGCYVKQLPLWDDIITCFPRKIRPTDVDGLVEINRQFLFLEEKRKGAGPDDGQRIAYKRLAEIEQITVVFFRPAKEAVDDELLEVLVFGRGPAQGWQTWDRRDFLNWLSAWTVEAECCGQETTA